MTKRERAIAAARAARVGVDGWSDDLVAALDAYHEIMTEPDEPPEGKLRVRVCVSAEPGGRWFAEGRSDMIDDYARARVVPADVKRPHRVTWIEADVTPWQPPAEETVQGREVAG